MSQQNKFKTLCPYCDKETVCDIKAKEKNNCAYEYYETSMSLYILQCCGCENIFLYGSDWAGCSDDDQQPIPHIYPEPSSVTFKHHKPKENIYIHKDGDLDRCQFAQKLYEEVCTAINREQNVVAAVGMRTLINICCLISTGSDDYTTGFTKNLTSLEEKGYLAAKSKDFFLSILELGHAATHRTTIPRTKHLVICINAIESLIESLFVFPDDSAELARSTPPKPKRKKVDTP